MKALVSGVGDTRFLVSPHAIERYSQRASSWPDDPDRARRQLGGLIRACGQIVEVRPGWLQDRPEETPEEAERYLMLGDDITLPLLNRKSGLVAVTCIARGGMSGKARERRKEYRAARAEARRRQRETRSWLGESGPRWR